MVLVVVLHEVQTSKPSCATSHHLQFDIHGYDMFPQAIIASAIQRIQCNKLSIRHASLLLNLKHTTLQNRVASIRKGLEHAHNRGRRPTLTSSGEKVFCDTFIEFSDIEFYLSRSCVKNCIELFISNLPFACQQSLLFRNGRSGNMYVQNFLRRHLG